MKSLHVAVAQIQSRVGDVPGNLARMHQQIRSAAAVGVEALLFAETTLHAYDFSADNLALAETTDGASVQQVAAWSAQYQLTILIGLLELADGKYYNSQFVIQPDGQLFVQRKYQLTPKEIQGGLSAGPRERTIFQLNGVRCAILICADTGVEGIGDDLLAQGVEFCFIPTAGGGRREDYLHEADLATESGLARYRENRPCVFRAEPILLPEATLCPVAFAAANALGDDGRDVVHQGHCMIADRHHILRAQIPGTNVVEHFLDQMAHAVLYFPGS